MTTTDDLTRLAAAVTPGPWKAKHVGRDDDWIIQDSGGTAIGELWYLGATETPANAAYIVAACNAVPELVDALAAKDARIDELQLRLAEYEDVAEDARRDAVLLEARADKQSARIAALEAALDTIRQWADAYPVDVFPDQNLQFIASVLREAGCSMTALHGQWGRYIAQGVGAIAVAVLAGEDA